MSSTSFGLFPPFTTLFFSSSLDLGRNSRLARVVRDMREARMGGSLGRRLEGVGFDSGTRRWEKERKDEGGEGQR